MSATVAKQALYDVAVSGTQTTSWSQNNTTTQNCGGSHGGGSETIAFATQSPTRVMATQHADASVAVTAVAPGAQLADGSIHVALAGSTMTRQGTLTIMPALMSCPIAAGGGAGGRPPPPDCGTKPFPDLFADLAYDRSTTLELFNDSQDPRNLQGAFPTEPFSSCPYLEVCGNRYQDELASGSGGLPASVLGQASTVTVTGSGSAGNSESLTSDLGQGVTETDDDQSSTSVRWTATFTPVMP